MTAPRPIRIMSPELALKIAAGEVVERPASVVKELLDNAIDAGAGHVTVEVRDGGLGLIRVTDDGCGIPGHEVSLAFMSHATSKIAGLDDLEHLSTLGFRGEALPSIAAVSRIDVQTRVAGDDAGARYQMEYGKPLFEGACSAPEGLRIAVRDLFSNVPARRRFVRSQRAEAAQIQAVVMQYGLARPGVQFSLQLDGRLVFTSPGTGRLEDAVAATFGPDTAIQMLPLRAEHAGVAVEGLISSPTVTRSNRTALHFFVNGRPIQNRGLAFALEEAYSGYLMVGRHPLAAVHLRLPPEEVDANVHPSKSEVRFARSREVHGILHRATVTALLETRLAEHDVSLSAAGVEDEPANSLPLPMDDSVPAEAVPPSPRLLPRIPALRVFGQTNQTFIIAEGPQGLYMIDQHAAHERILFDQLDDQLGRGEVTSQPLLEPATVELDPGQIGALEENGELLAQAGFALEPFGNGACLVRAVPAISSRSAPAELVLEVLSELQNLAEPGAARERALAAMACKGAVKAGQALDVREMRELVQQLEHTPRPATCPHGRPTMVHLSHTQLEREFGRR